MSENRTLVGRPENVIYGAKITNAGLEVTQGEIHHFVEGDPSIETWTRPYNREPHVDLVECFKALADHAIEISCIDAKRVRDSFVVTGFSVKHWDDDAKASVHLQCKYRAIDGIMVPLACPNILIQTTSYKNKLSLNTAVVNLIEEVQQYVFAGKSATPWTLFDSPKVKMAVANPEPIGSNAV